jgi:hypothetical protein
LSTLLAVCLKIFDCYIPHALNANRHGMCAIVNRAHISGLITIQP